MIQLTNRAKVLAAYITQSDHYGRSRGVVLAETETDFVTWRIYSVLGDSVLVDGLYDAESGNYFHKRGEMQRGEDRQRAEIDFGERLASEVSANTYAGMKARCGD